MASLLPETIVDAEKLLVHRYSDSDQKRQININNHQDLLDKAKSGAVVKTIQGLLFLAHFDRRHPNEWPTFRRLVVRVKKRGLEPILRCPSYHVFPTTLVYSPPVDVRSPHFSPKYYLPNGTPNPNQFDEAADCRPGFSRLPDRRLPSGTVVELSIGGYAVLPAGYTLEERRGGERLYMQRVKKNHQLGARACYWSSATYGGVRVVWEPDEFITKEHVYLSSRFTPEGIPERAALLKQHLSDSPKAAVLSQGVL